MHTIFLYVLFIHPFDFDFGHSCSMFMRLLFLNKLAGFKVLGIWQHRKHMIYLWITFIYLFLIPDFQVLDVPLVN